MSTPVELTEWERSRASLWAATNAFTYAQHRANGIRMTPDELAEGDRWKALAEKLRAPEKPACKHDGNWEDHGDSFTCDDCGADMGMKDNADEHAGIQKAEG